jgi:hypothetical protein
MKGMQVVPFSHEADQPGCGGGVTGRSGAWQYWCGISWRRCSLVPQFGVVAGLSTSRQLNEFCASFMADG